MSKKVTIIGRDYRGASRKIARRVAHSMMKKLGCVRVNKHYKGLSSFFSQNWREYSNR